jgi:hypothetical protein
LNRLLFGRFGRFGRFGKFGFRVWADFHSDARGKYAQYPRVWGKLSTHLSNLGVERGGR